MIACRHGPHDPCDITRRAIVDHDHFEVTETLAKNRLETCTEMLLGSIHGHHDRDRRLRHHRGDVASMREPSQSSLERGRPTSHVPVPGGAIRRASPCGGGADRHRTHESEWFR